MQIAYTSVKCMFHQSPLYFSDELSTEISSLARSEIPVILCGDLNATTGNMLDYI